jgi:hypothetical protein
MKDTILQRRDQSIVVRGQRRIVDVERFYINAAQRIISAWLRPSRSCTQ